MPAPLLETCDLDVARTKTVRDTFAADESRVAVLTSMPRMRARVGLLLVFVVVSLLSSSPPATAAPSGGGRGGLTVGRLRWDGRDRPLGYIQFEPRVGWVVSSSKRGQRQTAYQILVASDPGKLRPGVADVWDSKKVVSTESINVRYGGPTPQARQRAYWTVRVWDKDDRPSAVRGAVVVGDGPARRGVGGPVDRAAGSAGRRAARTCAIVR